MILTTEEEPLLNFKHLEGKKSLLKLFHQKYFKIESAHNAKNMIYKFGQLLQITGKGKALKLCFQRGCKRFRNYEIFQILNDFISFLVLSQRD